jgi:hypothetical protein
MNATLLMVHAQGFHLFKCRSPWEDKLFDPEVVTIDHRRCFLMTHIDAGLVQEANATTQAAPVVRNVLVQHLCFAFCDSSSSLCI